MGIRIDIDTSSAITNTRQLSKALTELGQKGIVTEEEIKKLTESAKKTFADRDAAIQAAKLGSTLDQVANACGLTSTQLDDLKRKAGLAGTAFFQSKNQIEQFKSSVSDIPSQLSSIKAIASTLGIAVSFREAYEVIKNIVQSIDDYKKTIIGIAATLTDTAQASGDQLKQVYQYNLKYAEETYQKVELAASKFFASGKEMVEAWQILTNKGIRLTDDQDINNLGIIVDKIKLVTQGQSSTLQIAQEVRSAMSGQARAGDQLAMLLQDRLGPKWNDILNDHLKMGDALSFIAGQIQGVGVATEDIQTTISSGLSTQETLINQILRSGFKEMYDDISSTIQQINGFLAQQKSLISSMISGVYSYLKVMAQVGKEVAASMATGGPFAIPVGLAKGAYSAYQYITDKNDSGKDSGNAIKDQGDIAAIATKQVMKFSDVLEDVKKALKRDDSFLKTPITDQKQEIADRYQRAFDAMKKDVDTGKLDNVGLANTADLWVKALKSQQVELDSVNKRLDSQSKKGQNAAIAAERYGSQAQAYLDNVNQSLDQMEDSLSGGGNKEADRLDKWFTQTMGQIDVKMKGAKGSTDAYKQAIQDVIDRYQKLHDLAVQKDMISSLKQQAEIWQQLAQVLDTPAINQKASDSSNAAWTAELSQKINGQASGEAKRVWDDAIKAANTAGADMNAIWQGVADKWTAIDQDRNTKLAALEQASNEKRLQSQADAYKDYSAVSSKYWEAEKALLESHLEKVKANADDELAYKVYAAQQEDALRKKQLESESQYAGTFADTFAAKWSLAYGSYKSEITKTKESLDQMSESIIKVTDGMVDGIAGGFGDMIRNIGNGTASIEDLWKNMLSRMLDAFASFVEDLLKQNLKDMLGNLFGTSSTGAGSSQSYLASLFGGGSTSTASISANLAALDVSSATINVSSATLSGVSGSSGSDSLFGGADTDTLGKSIGSSVVDGIVSPTGSSSSGLIVGSVDSLDTLIGGTAKNLSNAIWATHNNPGNIRSGSGFAYYDSMQDGLNSMAKLLQKYQDKGFDTIEKIVNRYAPPSENNTVSYIDYVSKSTGFSSSQKLNLYDSATLDKMLRAMTKIEGSSSGLTGDMYSIASGSVAGYKTVGKAIGTEAGDSLADSLTNKTTSDSTSIFIGDPIDLTKSWEQNTALYGDVWNDWATSALSTYSPVSNAYGTAAASTSSVWSGTQSNFGTFFDSLNKSTSSVNWKQAGTALAGLSMLGAGLASGNVGASVGGGLTTVGGAIGMFAESGSLLSSLGSGLGVLGTVAGMLGGLFSGSTSKTEKTGSGYQIAINAGTLQMSGVDFYKTTTTSSLGGTTTEHSTVNTGLTDPDVAKKIVDSLKSVADSLHDYAKELGFIADNLLDNFSMPSMTVTGDQLDSYIRNSSNAMAFQALQNAGLRGAFDYVAEDYEVYVDEFARLGDAYKEVGGYTEAYGYDLGTLAGITQDQIDAIRQVNTEVAEGTTPAILTMAAAMGATADQLAQLSTNASDGSEALAVTDEQLSKILQADYASQLLDAVGGQDAFEAIMGNLVKNTLTSIGAYEKQLSYYTVKANESIAELGDSSVTIDNFWASFDAAMKQGLTVDQFESWADASSWVNNFDTISSAIEDFYNTIEKVAQSLEARNYKAQGWETSASVSSQISSNQWEIYDAQQAGYDDATIASIKETQQNELNASMAGIFDTIQSEFESVWGDSTTTELRKLSTEFDDLTEAAKLLGASEEYLTLIREDEAKIIAGKLANVLSDVNDELSSAVGNDSANWLVDETNKFQDWADAAEAYGATAEQLAGIWDSLDQIVASKLQDVFDSVQDAVDEATLTDTQSWFKDTQKSFADLTASAQALGATTEQLASIQDAQATVIAAKLQTVFDDVQSALDGATLTDTQSWLKDLQKNVADWTASAQTLGASEEQLAAIRDAETQIISAKLQDTLYSVSSELLSETGSDTAQWLQSLTDNFNEWIASAQTLGATEQQLTDIRDTESTIIAAKLQDTMDSVSDALKEAYGSDDMVYWLQDTKEQFAEWIDSASQLGATEQQLTSIRLAEAAVIQAKLQSVLDDIASTWASTIRTDAEQAITSLVNQFEKAAREATALGATEQQLSDIRSKESDILASKLSSFMDNINSQLSSYADDKGLSYNVSQAQKDLQADLYTAALYGASDAELQIIGQMYSAKVKSYYQDQIDSLTSELKTAADALDSFTDSLKDFLDQLWIDKDTSPLGLDDRFKAAQALYNQTVANLNSSDETTRANAQDNIQSVTQDYLDVAKEISPTLSDYNNIFLSVNDALGKAYSQARSEYNLAQDQLTALGAIDETTKSATAIMSQLQTLTSQQTNVLSNMASQLPSQITIAINNAASYIASAVAAASTDGGAASGSLSSSTFDVTAYETAKAAQLNSIKYQGKTNWTVSDVASAFASLGMTAQEHYALYGMYEGIMPFNAAKYEANKAAQLNSIAYQGRTNWTAADVASSFAAAGLTPEQHYQQYGMYEGISPFATGGLVEYLAKSGGYLPGYSAEDVQLAILRLGEYVMTPEAVSKYGIDMMDSINHRTFEGFSTGGVVGGLSAPAAPVVSSTRGINGLDAISVELAATRRELAEVKQIQRDNNGLMKKCADYLQRIDYNTAS